MSLGTKIVVSAMRGIKKTGLIKGPGADLDAELRRARDYNRKHPYQEPTDRKAAYQTIHVGQYPCLVIRPENQAGKAILYLHGGGNHDAWKAEVAFARAYGKRAGMDVYYPLYLPFTEASPANTADFIFNVYRDMVKEYSAAKVAVLGSSYGGFLAMQLLTWINRNNADEAKAHVEMPKLLIMNSPFAYPKTEEEWKRAAALERDDAMITPGAFRWMLALTMKLAPDTPDWLLYPADMNFHHAPETCVFYTDEACSAVADAIQHGYERGGAAEKMHMHIEPGMMHCYASAPVFKESRRDFGQQIALLRQI